LVRRAAHLFAQRFPEGSPERSAAIGLLSDTKTPHRAAQKLLRALSPPQKPTRAVSGREQVGVGISILFLAIGPAIWLIAAKKLGIDENIRELVSGAIWGTGIGVILFSVYSPGPKAGLVYLCALAILAGLVWSINKWEEKSPIGWDDFAF